jgi:AcrR family transcriptional regulator
MASLHPTKQTLLDTVVELLNSKVPAEINSEEVLEISGISKGSLYHHYADFSELIEQALIVRFAHYVDASIAALSQVLRTAKSKTQLFEGLKQVTRHTQSEKMKDGRYERLGSMATAIRSPRMQLALGAEQERLTEALADLFRESQERGWGNKDFQPRVIAVMVQAYTMGKIVDDITPTHMDSENWALLIDTFLERIFFTEGN